LSNIDPEKYVNEITKTERKYLVELIKKFKLCIKSLRPIEEAIITSGGVNVLEISPKTMASKIMKGLYFAGELIDTDALTGGYNMQIAFSTGRLAGLNT
jgi:predicted flavoprotein YhiN